MRRRRRLSWRQAFALLALVSGSVVCTAAVLVQLTDPRQFPDFGTGVWWAITTVTTVGYGDVVPSSSSGRLIGAVLMFVGIGSIAVLTALAASAIVVSEVTVEEHEIERQESLILRRLDRIERRLRKLEPQSRPNARGPDMPGPPETLGDLGSPLEVRPEPEAVANMTGCTGEPGVSGRGRE
jgi:voltage-gated potassium channel